MVRIVFLLKKIELQYFPKLSEALLALFSLFQTGYTLLILSSTSKTQNFYKKNQHNHNSTSLGLTSYTQLNSYQGEMAQDFQFLYVTVT